MVLMNVLHLNYPVIHRLDHFCHSSVVSWRHTKSVIWYLMVPVRMIFIVSDSEEHMDWTRIELILEISQPIWIIMKLGCSNPRV